jgi:hypothetical protein
VLVQCGFHDATGRDVNKTFSAGQRFRE